MSAGRGLLLVEDPYEVVVEDGLRVWISSRIRQKRELFAAYQRQLLFPDYFGGNWDALNDCLHDLSWLPADTEIVVIHDGLPFGRGVSRSQQIYLELLAGLLEEETETANPWTLVFPQSASRHLTRLMLQG
ncbi:hypothetical protein GC163_10675 [bacterium]|nr:hypothetical protein [bacterium]